MVDNIIKFADSLCRDGKILSLFDSSESATVWLPGPGWRLPRLAGAGPPYSASSVVGIAESECDESEVLGDPALGLRHSTVRWSRRDHWLPAESRCRSAASSAATDRHRRVSTQSTTCVHGTVGTQPLPFAPHRRQRSMVTDCLDACRAAPRGSPAGELRPKARRDRRLSADHEGTEIGRAPPVAPTGHRPGNDRGDHRASASPERSLLEFMSLPIDSTASHPTNSRGRR